MGTHEVFKRMQIPSRGGIDPQPLSHFTDRNSTLHDLHHSVLFDLIRKPYSFTRIRLSLIPKTPRKTSPSLAAPQADGLLQLRAVSSTHGILTRNEAYLVEHIKKKKAV
jgi:hypothetical protein